MTSSEKRHANRLNALRSSGPKSKEGRLISSLNAVKHGLSQPVDLFSEGIDAAAMAELLRDDGLDVMQAQELASKMLDYEINMTFRVSVYQALERSTLQPTTDLVLTWGRDVHPGIDELEKMLRGGVFVTGKVAAMFLRSVSSFRAASNRCQTKQYNHVRRSAERDATNSLRYLRRSSNQLIKCLKSLARA